MSKSVIRELTVLRTQHITPHMKRITLGGDDLSSFPRDHETAYVKLMFPRPAASKLSFNPMTMLRKTSKPWVRTYTVRRFDPDTLELDIDFVIHGDDGPASKWAMNASPGAQITLTGPGARKLVDLEADWFFLVGDMTALPALAINLESLPRNAKGYFVVEIMEEADAQELKTPQDVEVHWVIAPHPGQENTCLVDTVKALPFLEGRPSIWAACEFASMRALRQYFRHEKQVDRSDSYISSYWKKGLSEEQHKVAKRRDSGGAMANAQA